MQFAVGQRVQVRSLEWEIVELQPLGGQHRLRLRCANGDLRGLEWDVLHPLEPIAPLPESLQLDRPVPLAAWRLRHMAALLDQVLASDTPTPAPGRLQIEPYQLVPLMRALELPRPRLLLADDVGLGKTVQAGLIVTELIARRQAHRVLVVTPAGPLLLQWQQEFRVRFGLRFTVLADGAALEAARRAMPLGGNPFDHHALVLVALDFAKQERVLQELERAAWDLAIVDEAHHCVAAGLDREATLRRRLAEVVAQRSDGLLLLTATPHDGHDPHFCSLIELLDPSLVDGRGGLVGTEYRRHVVRRLKSHLRDPDTGAPLFAERSVVPVPVALHGAALAPVRAFHQALADFVLPRLRGGDPVDHGRPGAGRDGRDEPGHDSAGLDHTPLRGGDTADTLAFVGLLKRSVSTIRACVNTLRVVAERYRVLADDPAHAAALRRERARALRAWRRRSLRFGTLDAAEEGDAERLEAEHIAADLQRGADASPALQTLIALGEAAAGGDPKLHALLEQVRQIRAQEPDANILVYTEYADSQAAAAEALGSARDIAGAVLTISGLDAEAARSRAAERCAAEDRIILLSTDSLAEGLNLQQRCHHLIHLDLPYNPNRLEQRNGRIDRYGQRRTPVIRYLYLAGTFEERLLLRLIGKYEAARTRLDAMPRTLGVTADAPAHQRPLMTGFAEEQARLFDTAAPLVRTLDQAAEDSDTAGYRDLLHEIDRAFAGYDRDAVRHGWFAGQGVHADPSAVSAGEAARRRGERELGCIDMAEFVAAALTQETGVPACPDRLQLPADWQIGLDTLPGYDAASGVMRITRARDRLRDEAGHKLAFLGRAHKLVRQAVARAAGGACVSVARAGGGLPAGALLTFTMELHAAHAVALRRVIAVLLPRAGDATVLRHPADWLNVADPPHDVAAAAAMPARWLQARRPAAEAMARVAAQQEAEAFSAVYRRRMQHAADALQHWLERRCHDICGPADADIPDLFGTEPPGPAWRSPIPALQRLAAYALDQDNPAPRRREANSAVELYRRRDADHAARAILSPPIPRPLGLLLLLPRVDG